MSLIFRGPLDLRHLDFEECRVPSGMGGTLAKAACGGFYYKLPSYGAYRGPAGLEPVTELVVSRLLEILGVPHLDYDLVDALVTLQGEEVRLWVSRFRNFRLPGQRKQALDTFFELHRNEGETPCAFVHRMGWEGQINTMLAVDYLILNRDRHGANIEVLMDCKGGRSLSPLFDHGLALLALTPDDPAQVKAFDSMRDRPVNSFMSSRSLRENLKLIRRWPHWNPLTTEDKVVLLKGLDGVVSWAYQEKMWEIIWRRWQSLEEIRHSG